MYLLTKQDVSSHETRALKLLYFLFLALFVMIAGILVQIIESGFLDRTTSVPLTPFFFAPNLGACSLSIL